NSGSFCQCISCFVSFLHHQNQLGSKNRIFKFAFKILYEIRIADGNFTDSASILFINFILSSEGFEMIDFFKIMIFCRLPKYRYELIFRKIFLQKLTCFYGLQNFINKENRPCKEVQLMSCSDCEGIFITNHVQVIFLFFGINNRFHLFLQNLRKYTSCFGRKMFFPSLNFMFNILYTKIFASKILYISCQKIFDKLGNIVKICELYFLK